MSAQAESHADAIEKAGLGLFGWADLVHSGDEMVSTTAEKHRIRDR